MLAHCRPDEGAGPSLSPRAPFPYISEMLLGPPKTHRDPLLPGGVTRKEPSGKVLFPHGAQRGLRP